MDKLDCLLCIISIGFTVNFILIILAWNNITKIVYEVDNNVVDTNKRTCKIEGIFSNKACYILKQNLPEKKSYKIKYE